MGFLGNHALGKQVLFRHVTTQLNVHFIQGIGELNEGKYMIALLTLMFE